MCKYLDMICIERISLCLSFSLFPNLPLSLAHFRSLALAQPSSRCVHLFSKNATHFIKVHSCRFEPKDFIAITVNTGLRVSTEEVWCVFICSYFIFSVNSILVSSLRFCRTEQNCVLLAEWDSKLSINRHPDIGQCPAPLTSNTLSLIPWHTRLTNQRWRITTSQHAFKYGTSRPLPKARQTDQKPRKMTLRDVWSPRDSKTSLISHTLPLTLHSTPLVWNLRKI